MDELIAEMDVLIESLKSSSILGNQLLSNQSWKRIKEVQKEIGELKIKRVFEKYHVKPKAA